MIATPDTPLRQFFESVFLKERLTGRNQIYIDTFPQAINWFEKALGREPRLRDLSVNNVRKTMRLISDCGNRSHWIEKMRNRLGSLWLHAHKIGVLTNYQEVSTADFRDDRMRFLEDPPPERSVRAYYMANCREGYAEVTKQDCDAAVKNLDKFRGCYVMMADVSDSLLVDFHRWLTKAGKSENRCDRYVGAIRAICRHWMPSTFQRSYGRQELLPPAPEGSLRSLFETRYVPERMLDCTPGSIAQSRRALRRLYLHYGRDVMLTELDDSLIADHLSWLKLDQKLGHCTVNTGHRCTLLAVWRFAVEMNLMPKDPRVRKLKELRHEPDSWDPEDVLRLVNATTIFAGREADHSVPMDLMWRALLLTEWWTALRAGTLLKIKRQNVNLQTGWIYVEPESVKTGRGKKFRLGPDAVAALQAIWEPKRDLMFPWPYRRESLWRYFCKLQKAASVPESSRKSMSRFHKLRRTVATQAAVSAGLPAAIALLDHSGPEVTRRYLDPSKLPGCDATAFLPQLIDLGRRVDP